MLVKIAPALLFILAIVIALVLHSNNMFGYPYFESDEGTYTSQAWAVVTQHELAPYTYWYDHPPFGWMLLALWTLLFEGGFFAFGSSIETGRVFMLFVHGASVALVYYIVLHTTKRALPAFAATLFFSLSPLAIYFQRRVLLDNMMIFWILAAFAILYVPYKKMRLRNYVLSGLFFALAILTKITAVMFGPAFLFLLMMKESPVARYFRTTAWFMISGMITSVYLLYALLQNEFFPSKPGEPDHVSFLDALSFQSGRSGGFFLSPDSDFRTTLSDWFLKDEFFIYVAGFTLLIPALIATFSLFSWLIRYSNIKFAPGRHMWVFLICLLMYFLFLIRGGITFNFYVLPIIPFVGLCLAIFIHNVTEWAPREVYNTIFIIFILSIIGHYTFSQDVSRKHFWANETQNQKSAIKWVKENVDSDAAMLIDSYAYVDLHDGRYINGKEFVNADWYYKISRDPEIGEVKYNLNWRNFDYIGLTHEMMRQIREGDDPIVRTAFDNALPERRWTTGMSAFVDEQKLLSTNGDWAMLYKINDSSRAVLVDSWREYKNRFITLAGEQYGQVTDPQTGGSTSQGQAYAMLRAVSMYDREMFDAAWGWTQAHLQFRVEDKLFSREWNDDNVSNTNNATDADLDIALALVFAHRIWNDDIYKENAQEILDDIWRQTVVEIGDTHYLIALNKKSALSGAGQDVYLMNPSYFSPAWYRIFAEIDTNPAHQWEKLAGDSYDILERISDAPWNATELPMNMTALNISTGRISSAAGVVQDRGYANSFSEDASRALWRASVDVAWFEDDAARAYLDRINTYLASLQAADGSFPSTVRINGTTSNVVPSRAVSMGYLSALMWNEDDVPLAQDYYTSILEESYDEDENHWDDGSSYYDANWSWFGFALYNKKFVNLWETSLE